MAQYLVSRSGVEVLLEHGAGGRWDLQWADGPTYRDMKVELEQALAARPFALMRDREVRLWRGSSFRAWAATAVAAHLDDDGLPTDRYAIQALVEDAIDNTAHPARARSNSHEPMIEQLLRYRHPSEMAEALAADPDRALGGDDAQVISFPIRRPEPD